VLAIAHRNPLPEPPDRGYAVDWVERDLTFPGLLAMMDPPRPEVADAVRKCHHAGIRISLQDWLL
jgi:magnesium-transporting ATPase (P-type)